MISVSDFQELVTSGIPSEGDFQALLTWYDLSTLSLAMDTW